jgi:hypothetical protein
MFHVIKVNDDITNIESLIDINLNVFIEEIGYDMKMKEKINVKQVRVVRGKLLDMKSFIELTNKDKDYIMDLEVINFINILPDEEDMEPAVDENIPISSVRYDCDPETDDSVNIFGDESRNVNEYLKLLLISILTNPKYYLEKLVKR